MNQEKITSQVNFAQVGEAISHELAAKMVKDFNDAHPQEQYCFSIGRNIIEQVLAQPGCAGIRIYKALNEEGNQTLVYAGIDHQGHTIMEYAGVNENGVLIKSESLIGDRTRTAYDWFE